MGVDACALMPPSSIPDPTVPTPAPAPSPVPTPVPTPVPMPQPPVPTRSNCTFENSTTYKDSAYRQVKVALNDYNACCDLCFADAACIVAQMHHGTGDANIDVCRLLGTAKRKNVNMVSPPALELACIPKRDRNAIDYVV